MSVLGTIAKRLQTDIADIARATIDPQFSRELDRRESTRQQFDRERAAALEDRETLRQQRLEDEDRLLSNRLQMAAITETFTRASNTNDWGAWAGLISGMEDNENVNEAIKRYAFDLNNNQGTKSIDRLKLEHQWQKEKDKMSLEERKLLLQQDRYITEKDQWFAEQALNEEKLRFKQMQDLRDQAEQRNNRSSLIEFVRNTPDIETPAERQAFLNRLNEASPDQLITVWDEIMARRKQRIDNAERAHRNRVNANALKAARGTSPSGFDIDFAADVLNEKLGDRWDAMDEESQAKMARFVADQTRYLSRDERTASSNKVLEVVDKAIAGLEKTEWGWLWGVPDEDFSVGRAQEGDTQSLANEADAWARENGIKAGEIYQYGGRNWRFGG